MDYMELEFPGDARDALVHTRAQHGRRRALELDGGRRGPGGVWARAAAQIRLDAGGSRRAAGAARHDRPLPHLRALRHQHGRHRQRHAPRARRRRRRHASTRASRSTGRSSCSIASGAISRTCRGSCTTCESVERVTDTLSRWRAEGPGGSRVEWSAEIINEVPNQVIGWRSIEGSDVVSAGSVHFDDAGRTRHARARPASVQPARRQGRRGGREADGSRSRHRDPRRPAPVQAAHRKHGTEIAERSRGRRVSTRRTPR